MDEEAQTRKLVDRARSGDSLAAGELYDRYRDRIYRYVAYRLAPGTEAEDATSAVFEGMLRGLASFRWKEGSTFDSWVFRIAHNVVASEFRRRKRAKEVSLEGFDKAEPSAGPEDIQVARATREELRAALAHLTEDQRQVVALRLVAGLSAGEVGTVMGRSEGAVRIIQFRALDALRRVMGVKQ
jgi:RNA polymerase sigma-70 factor (ECF subfamily)